MPVIAGAGIEDENVQHTDMLTWTRVHVSFQSTSSTNISTVNALNKNKLASGPKSVDETRQR